VIGFAAWLGLCVYVGGLLDGNRAYSGILSGYTVALVAVTQIDSPQNIFLGGRQPRRGDRGRNCCPRADQ